MSKPRIAFLGLGTMGAGMANRLVDAGYPFTVYNRNPDRAQPFAAKGARIAATPRGAARDANVIIARLSDDVSARRVWLGESGALAIDSSTLTIACAREN